MLYFRADMNNFIATGHIMRCLSIADAAKKLGEDSTFILSDTEAAHLVESRGYLPLVLGSRWDDLESELPVLCEIIQKKQVKMLLVDSYYVTQRYLNELCKQTYLIYLDDLNAFHYPVDAIICYANYYKKFSYEKAFSDKQLLLGTKYVPLRLEFSDCPPKKISQRLETLLLMSGGTDEYGILPQLMKRLNLNQYETYLVCGRYNRYYDLLCELYGNCEQVHIIKSVDNVKDYMDLADLAVSAAGSTLYELCAVGTPAISYSIADNQLNNAVQFDRDAIIDYAGDLRTDNVVCKITELIEKYLCNRQLRQVRSLNMQMLVDGLGADRIARWLIQSNQRENNHK